jgi:hypothetical protein
MGTFSVTAIVNIFIVCQPGKKLSVFRFYLQKPMSIFHFRLAANQRQFAVSVFCFQIKNRSCRF